MLQVNNDTFTTKHYKNTMQTLLTLVTEETNKLRARLAKLEQLSLLISESFGESFQVVAPTKPLPVNDDIEIPKTRTYKIRNVGDALLEILPTSPAKAMLISEIVVALKVAGYTYAYGYVSTMLKHYRSTENDAFPFRGLDGSSVCQVKSSPNRYYKTIYRKKS